MPSDYSDDALLSALEDAHGDDRVLLVGALGDAHGDRGPEALRKLAAPESGEGGYLRAAAIGALARRMGAAAAPTYLRGLRDKSVPVQLAAAEALAECGDERATTEMLAWLRRKLRRKGRLANWDPDEVRSALRFADRNGALREVAAALDEHRDRLHPDEHRWLLEVWPALATGSHAPGDDMAPPDRQLLGQPMIEDHRDEPDPEDDEMWDELVRQALARAQRGAQGRTGNAPSQSGLP
jgi:hypothetical protein